VIFRGKPKLLDSATSGYHFSPHSFLDIDKYSFI